MKQHIKKIKIYLLVTIAISLFTAFTFITNTYTLARDYAFAIHGTSNLHNWVEKVVTVSGTGVVNWNTDESFDIKAINLAVDVRSIQSDMGAVMNSNTYKALKADKNPKIIFTLSTPVTNIQTKLNVANINVIGKLTIAGVSRSINMQAKLTVKGHDHLTFEGEQYINMTDYGIKPPKALFGTLQTGSKVKIKFKTAFNITSI